MHDRSSALRPLFAFFLAQLTGCSFGSTCASSGGAIRGQSRARGALRSCAAVLGVCLCLAWQGVSAQVAQLQFTPSQLNVIAGTGSGTVNGTGDGGSALSATFDSPAGVAQDSLGNIYVVDSAANYVRKFDVNGNITAFAGVPGYGPGSFSGDTGQATAAHLSNPIGIAIDSLNNVYIADEGNFRIRKVVPSTGIITTYAGTGNGFFTGANAPNTVIPGPEGIAFDSSNNLYIACTNASLVLKVASSGATTIVAGVLAVSGSGTPGYNGDNILANIAEVDFPTAVATDQAGNVYIADSSNNRIRKITVSTGMITTVAGNGTAGDTGDGATATNAEIYATAVAVDLAGDIFIASDSGGATYDAVRKVDVNGNISTVAGSGSGTTGGEATAAQIGGIGIPAVDSYGDLIIPDYGYSLSTDEVMSAGPAGYLQFGNQSVGLASAPQTVTFENTGNATLTLSQTTYSATAPFTVTGGTCVGRTTLASGATCTLTVTFTPTSAVAYTGAIAVNSNDTLAAQTITLAGTGASIPAPTVSLAPSPVAFGNQTINTTSTPSMVAVLMNTGSATLTGISISVTGTNANAFGLNSSACGTTLAMGASCNISLNFTPTATGANTATLTVSDNAANSPQSVTLTGTGIPAAAPAATLSPGTLNFGGVQIDTTSPALIETVTNTGGGTVDISSVSIVQSGTNVFFLGTGANQCTNTTSLSNTQSCNVYVTFDPSVNGQTYNASLHIADDASGSPQTASLTGVGDYFDQDVGNSTSKEPVSVFITTGGTLSATNVVTTGVQTQEYTLQTGGTCAIGTAYTAGQVCTVDVIFAPQYSGARNGSIYLTDASGNILGTTFLQGTGNAPQIIFGPVAPQTVVGFTTSLAGVAVDAADDLFYVNGSDRLIEAPVSGPLVTVANLNSLLGGVAPNNVAIDLSGNLFIGSNSSTPLIEVPRTGLSTWGTPVAINTGSVANVAQVAVDPLANLYIVAPAQNAVYQLPFSSTGYGTPMALPFPGSGAFKPASVAVDPFFDVWAIGQNASNATQLIELPVHGTGYGTPVTTAIAQLPFGSSVATDGNGNVYVSGQTSGLNGAVYFVPATGSPVLVGAGLDYSLVLDSASNIYAVQPNSNDQAEILEIPQATPPSLSFATTNVGSTSSDSPKTVMVTNVGNEALDFYSNSSYPTDFPENYNDTHLCNAEYPLNPGAECDVSVNFTPTTGGNLNEDVTLKDENLNNSSSSQMIAVSGDATAVSAPIASLSPNPLAFPSTTVGTSATSLPMTLSNTGAAALTITSISVTGTNASSFGQSNNCGSSLAAGANCTITVTFTPGGIGSLSAAISVADNAAGSPQSAVITGNGIRFVSNVGTALAAEAVTVPITAPGTLNSIQVLTQGVPNLDFTLASGGTCTTTTAYTAGQTCTVNIVFTPAFAGSRLGGVALSTASGGVLGIAHLNGTGNGPQLTFLPNSVTMLGGSFATPYSVAVNGNGTAFVANTTVGTMLEIPSGCTSSGCVVAVGSGFSSPTGVALDGFGNLYVADAGFATIKEILAVNGSIPATPTINTLANDFNFPFGIAVDGNGNVYVSDEGTGSVYEMLAVGGTIPASPTIKTLSSTFTDPAKIAVDANGDVYVADQGNNAAKEILAVNGSIPASPTINVLGSGFSSPAGIALDGSGDVYVSDSNHNQIKALMESGGNIPASPTIVTLASSLTTPLGDAVGGNGNVYFADGTVGMLNMATPPSLSFASTSVGSTSADSPKTVSIQNIGDASLTFGSIVASTNFKLDTGTTTCSISNPLSAGTSCVVGVDFVPTASGTLSGTLVLTDNNLNGSGVTQTISLSGTGTGAGASQAVLSPNPLAFPSTLVGTSSTALPMTLSNPGTAALTISSISVTGTNASSFGQSNNCGGSLAVGANCTITATFTPGATGSLTAAISVADNATGSPHTATLTGTGTAPQAAFTLGTLTFPSTLVGTSATTQSTTLSNPGTAALTITGISVTGTNASSFGQSNNCGASLAAGATCTITVTFTPASSGSLGASVSVADNAAGSPQTVTLAGTGTAPQAVLSPNPLAFPATLVGTAATSLPMTLSNPGTAALTISTISVTGANASSFGQSNNCGSSLAVGATCTITVTFTPASAASLTAAISVADNATGSPQSAAITGTGTPPLIPQAAFGPTSLTFPSTTINTSATPLPITLSNPGNTPLVITSISVTGANASSFGQTNNCPASLAAGATCTITVTFTPASAATFNAAISVTDNAAGSPQSAAISGIGSAGTYVVNSSTPSANIQPGAVAQFNLVVAPLGGSFNNLVTLSATGLPVGATVSFLPPAVTPGSAGAPSVMSIQTSTGLARLARPESHRQNPVPLLALLAGVPLLGLAAGSRRLRRSSQRWMLLGLAALAILPMLALSGCGGGYFGPAPKAYTVTVTGTSGSLQESTTVSLTVQ